MNDYRFKTGEFEGPLELLLRLIDEKKLHVSRVSLAAVADQFLAYLKSGAAVDKTQVADFLFTASTLMLIKSVSLLPVLEVTAEEERSMTELEERLLTYQKIRKLSRHLQELFGKRIIFTPRARQIQPLFSPGGDLSLSSLVVSFKELLAALPSLEKVPAVVVKQVLRLEQAIENLLKRVEKALKTSFRDFIAAQGQQKMTIIVSFLGLLELVKRGAVRAEQNGHLSDILIEKVD